MTLPASGAISLSQVNTELGLSSTATISLGDSAVRALFGVASGAISMSNGYGKANQFAFTISANQTNANLASLATAAGWNGTSKVVATINSGIYISSNSTGTPALTVSGSFPGGVELINNGYIVGMGGNGGAGAGVASNNTGIAGSAGAAGGVALSTSSAITIYNAGTIAGGGGGGGGGQSASLSEVQGDDTYWYSFGGGGGGGGRSSAAANTSGGGGGSALYSTGLGVKRPGSAGGGGTVSSNGAGGAPGIQGAYRGGYGGNGGGWGSSGSGGGTHANCNYPKAGPYSGGGAGNAVSGNANITWSATGTRLGGIA